MQLQKHIREQDIHRTSLTLLFEDVQVFTNTNKVCSCAEIKMSQRKCKIQHHLTSFHFKTLLLLQMSFVDGQCRFISHQHMIAIK